MTSLIHQTGGLAAEIATLRNRVEGLSDELRAMNEQVAAQTTAQNEQLAALNHSVLSMNHAVERSAALTEAHHTVLLELNHDVRAGSERALPLFLGYAERLRLDTDTAISAAQIIERQLAILEDLVAANETTAAT